MNTNPEKSIHDQIADLSPQQREALAMDLSGIEPDVEAVKRGDAVIDYTVRRKRIYKGKVCPQGTVYLVVTVKTEKRKMEAYQVIPGNMDQNSRKALPMGCVS